MHLCCLLKNDMNAKRSNQSKSALYKQALFSFPSLSFFATAVLYLLVFEFSIVIVNCVKELGPFCLAWLWCSQFSISNGVVSAFFKQPLQPVRKWQHSQVDTVVLAIFK